ncbi:hypothetical protein BaRGS_00013048 [Batillaria attramentaria]|uniref:Uncharacterized protein n=1 Tax=Batillaria attramentaria TaxID=370345 RepID=A0ABD0L8I5_9CAEN
MKIIKPGGVYKIVTALSALDWTPQKDSAWPAHAGHVAALDGWRVDGGVAVVTAVTVVASCTLSKLSHTPNKPPSCPLITRNVNSG